jgi:hypothetical protein
VKRYLPLTAFLLLVSIALLFLFRGVFHIYFFSDDIPGIIHSTESLKDIFLENRHSRVFYTPLAVLLLKPDFMIFGLNPVPYHIHNFIIIVLIAIVFYRLARIYTDKTNALIPTLILLFSTPSLLMASWIIMRQYLYPALFSLTAIYLFIRYQHTEKNRFIITCVILVLNELSFLGKEQFMTLPFVLFALSSGNLRKRISNTFPYFALLLCHFLFRIYVIKGFGGYLGMTFDLKVYLTTMVTSLFAISRIVFGYSLFIILIIAPLILTSLRKTLYLFIIWVCSLGIQFLTMSSYPDALTLRYWFIPMIILSLIVAVGAESIRNIRFRAAYLILVVALFSLNTYSKESEVKAAINRESFVYKSVFISMTDRRYADSQILIFNEAVLEKSAYFKGIDILYTEKLGLDTFPVFFPADFLLFYPQLLKKNDAGIFEIKEDGITDISDRVRELLANYKKNFVSFHPEIRLISTAQGQALKITCTASPRNIFLYVITRRADYNNEIRLFYDRIPLPYVDEINIGSLTKLEKAELLPEGNVSFQRKRGWIVNNAELEPFPSEALITFSCVTDNNKITFPSDFIHLKRNNLQ